MGMHHTEQNDEITISEYRCLILLTQFEQNKITKTELCKHCDTITHAYSSGGLCKHIPKNTITITWQIKARKGGKYVHVQRDIFIIF